MARQTFDPKLATRCVNAVARIYRQARYDARRPITVRSATAAIKALLHPDAPKGAVSCYAPDGLIKLGKARLVAGFKPPHDEEPYKTQIEYRPAPVCTAIVQTDSGPEFPMRLYLTPHPDGRSYCLAYEANKKRAVPVDAKPFDPAKLRKDVRAAAERALKELRKKAGKEPLYAFALYSDDDAMTLIPAANTESGLRACAERYGFTTAKQIDGSLRWSTAEWAYEGVGADRQFNEICEHLARFATGDWPVAGGHRRFRKQVYEAAIGALEDLDADGAFGRGKDRERLTLFVTISDSDVAPKLERASAKRLNSPEVYRRFQKR